MDLQELKFKVNTEHLDAAITKISQLGTAVKELSKPLDEAAKNADKVAKANKKITDSTAEAEANVNKLGSGVGRTAKTLDGLKQKIENTTKDLADGFTRSESAVLNQVRALKASQAQFDEFVRLLKNMSKFLSDPFDKAFGSVRSITRELDMLNQRAGFAAAGISLTTKQLREYSRISDEVAGKLTANKVDISQGIGQQQYIDQLKKSQADYINAATQVNNLTAAEKARQKALKETEAAAKANASVGDAMVAQYNKQRQAINSVIDRLKAQRDALLNNSTISAANLTSKVGAMQGARPEDVAAAAALKKEVEALTKANSDNARAVKASIAVGDEMTNQFRNRQAAIQSEIDKLNQRADILKRMQQGQTRGEASLAAMGASPAQIAAYKQAEAEIEKLTQAERAHRQAMEAGRTAGDAMVAQYRNRQTAIQGEIDKLRERENLLRATQSGMSRGEAQLSAMGATPAQLQAYRNQLAAVKALEQAEKQRSDRMAADRSAGDAMVAQYRRQQQGIQGVIDKLREQATALRAGSTGATGTIVNQLTNLGATPAQIAQAKALRAEIEAMNRAARTSTGALSGMASIVRQLIPALGALSAGAIAAQMGAEFVKTADFLTLLEARLNFLSKGTLEFNSAFGELVVISNEARTSVQDTSTFFSRLVPIMQSVGRSTKDAFTVTESFSKLLLVSGTSSREASSAMYQLSQALGKGKLDGDEFRTMAEAVPELLRILEKQLGVTRGELYKMSEQGKLTADVIMTALVGALPSLGQAVAEMPKTVNGALVILRNTGTELVKVLDDATGVTEGLAGIIEGFSDLVKIMVDNEKVVLSVMGAITGAAAVSGLALISKGIGGVAGALSKVGYALGFIVGLASKHPIVAALIIGATAAGAVYGYFQGAEDNVTKLQGKIKKLKEDLKTAAADKSISTEDLLGINAELRKAEMALDNRSAALVKKVEALKEKLNSPYTKGVPGASAAVQKELDAARQELFLTKNLGSGYETAGTSFNTGTNDYIAKQLSRVEQITLEASGFKGAYAKFIEEMDEVGRLVNFGLSREAAAAKSLLIYEKYGLTKKPGSTTGAENKAATERAKAMETYGDLVRKEDGYLKDYNNKQDQLNLSLKLGDIAQSQYNEAFAVLLKQQPLVIAQMKEQDELERSRIATMQTISDKEIEGIFNANESNRVLAEGNTELREQIKALGLTEEQLNDLAKAKELAIIQQKELNLLGLQNTEEANSPVIAALEREIALLKEKVGLTSDLKNMAKATEKVKQESEKMADVFTSAFSDLISGGKSFGDVLVDLGRSIANLITEIMVLEPLKASLRSSFQSSGGMSGLINTAVSFLSGSPAGTISNGMSQSQMLAAQTAGFADGGAFMSGIQKFANGGSFTNKIVNKPTNFNIGQMGEAGPEAIMPLMRTSSGALGVQAAGGSGSNVSVVVVNNTSEKAETKETVDSKGNRRVEVMIGDMVAGEMGRSSSGIQRSMKSTFGLQPSLVRR